MIWFWAIAAAILVGVVFRFLAEAKVSVLALQAKYQGQFFERAHEIADWDDISDGRLRELSELSAGMRSRKMQMIVMEAIRHGLKRAKSGSADKTVQKKSELTAERHSTWNQMYFRWLCATVSQGSIMGIGGLIKLLEYFDPDDKDKMAAEVNSLRLEGVGAHSH